MSFPFLSLREAFVLPGGWGACSALARPRSRRAKTPEATTRQCGPGRGPSVSANSRVPDTPPRVRTPGTPWPPEISPPHPSSELNAHHPKEREKRYSGGELSLRRCRGGPITPQPAGTGRASRAGRRRRGLIRTLRGPGADRALRSRAEEPAGAGRGGAQACRRTPRHRQKTAPRSGNKKKQPRSENNRPWRSAGSPPAEAPETRAHRLVALAGRDLENHRQ